VNILRYSQLFISPGSGFYPSNLESKSGATLPLTFGLKSPYLWTQVLPLWASFLGEGVLLMVKI